MLFRILSFTDTPLRGQAGVTYHMCLMMIMMMVVIILSLYIEAVITLLLLTIG